VADEPAGGRSGRELGLVVAGTCLIAGTYGLVRLAYGLFLPDISDSLPLGSALAGYVSSGASAAYCAGALVGLLAGDRPRLLVTAALGTAAVGALGMALAPGLWLFVPAAVLASAGAGFASPGLVGVVARNIAADRMARAQAIVNSGTGPGLVGAGLLALVVSQWRLGFVLGAAFTAVAGLCVLVLDHAGPRRTDPHPTGPAPTGSRWYDGVRRLAGLGRPTAGALLLGAASATVWTYGRAHLVAAGASDTESVVAWIAIGVGGSATVLTARRLGALPAPRAWMLTTVSAAAATAALFSPGPLAVAVGACALFGWGFVAASSALIVWVGEVAPQHAAAGTSAVFIALVVGQAVGSTATGSLSGVVGLPGTFALAAATAVLASAAGWTQAAWVSRSGPAGRRR